MGEMRSLEMVSGAELELLLVHFKESYKLGNFVSDKSLSSIVPGITFLHKRHHLKALLDTLEKEYKCFFKYKSSPQKGYYPISHNTSQQPVSKFKLRLIFIHFRESYETSRFVSHESLNSIVPGITSVASGKNYYLKVILDALERDGYLFKYQSTPEKGYRPVYKNTKYKLDINFRYTTILVSYFKKAYESNTFIKYQDIESIISNDFRRTRSHTENALNA